MEHSTGSSNDTAASNSHLGDNINCDDDNETTLMAAVAATAAAVGPLNLDHKSFKHLLDTQSLVDCTLACEGGKVSAHKGVLAACSSYLAKILLEHPVEHPIIILPELNIDDVKTLVHYMYTGELLRSDTIHSTSLLRTAAILCVNSLNDLNTTTNTSASNHYFAGVYNPITNSIQQVSGSTNNTNTNNHNFNTSINFNNSNLSSLTSMNSTINNSIISNGRGGAANSNMNSNHHILNSSTFSSSSNNGSGNHNGSKSEFQFKCPVCQNDFQTICSFEYHMQRIHNVTSFGCEICHKPFVSLRYVLTDHMRRCHGWKADQKLQC